MEFPNEPARTDPDKLVEVQQAVLRAVDIGAQILPLLQQLEEVVKPLPPKYIDSPYLIPGDDIHQKWFAEVRSDVATLRRNVDQAFNNLADRAVNTTYLGNMSVRNARITREQEAQ